jgi:hypothetical protein
MPTNPTSIRQICLNGFLAGKTRAAIAEEIKAQHPNSQAAAKSARHIAWHYGDMKKQGLLGDAPKVAEAPATTTKVVRAKKAAASVVDPIALQAEAMAAAVDATL